MPCSTCLLQQSYEVSCAAKHLWLVAFTTAQMKRREDISIPCTPTSNSVQGTVELFSMHIPPIMHTVRTAHVYTYILVCVVRV